MPHPERSIFPPRYLSALPPAIWFWEAFGQDHDRAFKLWAVRAQLVRVSEAQNWRCCYCAARADPPVAGYPKLWEATREHVIPISKGGGDGDDNVVMACSRCNSVRSDRDAHTFQRTSVRYG